MAGRKLVIGDTKNTLTKSGKPKKMVVTAIRMVAGKRAITWHTVKGARVAKPKTKKRPKLYHTTKSGKVHMHHAHIAKKHATAIHKHASKAINAAHSHSVPANVLKEALGQNIRSHLKKAVGSAVSKTRKTHQHVAKAAAHAGAKHGEKAANASERAVEQLAKGTITKAKAKAKVRKEAKEGAKKAAKEAVHNAAHAPRRSARRH